MAFVIYDIETTKIYRASKNNEYSNTERAAKSALTRLLKEKPELVGKLAIADYIDFRQHIEKLVYRKNLMTGVMYLEAYNTPSYCSPSSEAFWSM